MQKHNLNAEFARLAPQFLAFLDKEEQQLRDEMARLKRKTTKDEPGGRPALLRRQRDADSAETPINERPTSAENDAPIGETLILSPEEAGAAALPEYIRLLQRIQPAHEQQQLEDEPFALDDTVIMQRQRIQHQNAPRPTDVPGLAFDE